MAAYVRTFDDNVTISFKISDKQLFKEYNQIRTKVEKLLKIEFDSKPVYGDDDKYIKTKIKNLCRQNDYKFSKQKNAKRKSFWKNVNMNQKE